MESEQPVGNPRWVYVGALTILGFGLLWWANDQFAEIRRLTGSNFEVPAGRLLVWLLTLIAAGLVFGLAVGHEVAATSRVAIAAWSILPLVILAWFYLRFFGLPAFNLPHSLFEFLGSQMTVVASSLTLGFYLSALVVNPIRHRRQNDQPASDGPG